MCASAVDSLGCALAAVVAGEGETEGKGCHATRRVVDLCLENQTVTQKAVQRKFNLLFACFQRLNQVHRSPLNVQIFKVNSELVFRYHIPIFNCQRFGGSLGLTANLKCARVTSTDSKKLELSGGRLSDLYMT